MNATKLFAFTLLTAVAGAAFAGEESATLQRAQVKSDVMHARQDGTLIRTGDASNSPCGQYVFDTGPSTLTRADLHAQVDRARTDGTLMPAGAALYGSRAMYDRPSTQARSEVKAQVVQARLQGTLLPAGEGYASSASSSRGAPFVVTQVGR